MNEELTEKQLKNLKRKIVSYIWGITWKRTIDIGLFCGIKIPKDLMSKYMSQDQEDQS